MATIESRSLDFNLAEVRGNRAPKERSRFTARQASAAVPVNCSESASSHDAVSIAAPSQTILTILDSKCCTDSQWLCTDAIGAVVMLSKKPQRSHLMWLMAELNTVVGRNLHFNNLKIEQS